MSNKEDNFKEKFKQALLSTAKVISDDYKINIKNFDKDPNSKKINFFGLDSSNSKMLNKFLYTIKKNFFIKKFDIIIDDGSHILSDQLFSINYFYKYLKKDGYYVIEDYKFPNYFKRCLDVKEDKIDILINKLKDKKIIFSNILEKKTIRELYNTKINCYKGNSKISDIVFFKKK